MKRVGAIGRLMASIALLAAGFSLCRAWAAPWESVREHPSDEMARAFLIILPAAGLALVLPGWPGRSLGRFAAAGALISVSCWLAPDPIREAILARVLIPIDRRFSARKSRGPTQLEVCLLKTGYASNIAIVLPKLRGYRSRPPGPARSRGGPWSSWASGRRSLN